MGSEREVARVDRSPMNPQVWCVQLLCGHEVWRTQRRRPTIKVAVCPRCAREEAPDA